MVTNMNIKSLSSLTKETEREKEEVSTSTSCEIPFTCHHHRTKKFKHIQTLD